MSRPKPVFHPYQRPNASDSANALSRIKTSFDNFLSGSESGASQSFLSESFRSETDDSNSADLKTQLIMSRCKETQLEKELNVLRTVQQTEKIEFTQKMSAIESGNHTRIFIH